MRVRRDIEIKIPEVKESEFKGDQESIMTMSPEKSTKAGATTNTHSVISSPVVMRIDSNSTNDNILSRKNSLNSSTMKRETTKTASCFISQAVKHSSSLIWNLKQQPNRTSFE
jgi:hypothetical protein